MTATLTPSPEQDALRRRTVAWVVTLATVGLIFDGYDLVVYGTVVSTFLRDPTQIGEVTPPSPARWAATRWSASW
jgi:MFS transporter, AAHS family, benzoate transport protein